MSPSIENRECRQFAAELKFPVSRVLAPQILAWARAKMQPDPHAHGAHGDGYTITSLYLDTAALDVFHGRGSFKRSKYRIRRYGDGEIAFLERKLRTRAMLTKRRSAVGLDERGGVELNEAVHAEWFRQRLELRQLTPKCQISYERTARVASSPHGPIRLTLDRAVRATPIADWQFVEGAGLVLAGHEMILELKYLCAVPALFKELVAEFSLNSRSHSKYRRAMAALGLAASAHDAGLQLHYP